MTDASFSRLSAWRVFLIFLRLGCTSFGGPVAHLAYFQHEFVVRRQWLSQTDYTELVALCQFLPGPSSSQVGMALGLRRAGWGGMWAAWLGFTLPSAVLLIALAYGVMAGQSGFAQAGWVHGLKIVAVAVVAQAVWTMAKALCPDRLRVGMLMATAGAVVLVPSAWMQVGALLVCGWLGYRCLPDALVQHAQQPEMDMRQNACRITPQQGIAALVVFAALLALLPLSAALWPQSLLAMWVDGVYRAGALVFGGGHVVLPLLQTVAESAGMREDVFLAGYGAAQAVPGPLFSFTAYLGTVAQGPLQGWMGGLCSLVVVFAPAALLLIAALPFWEQLRRHASARRALAGINAAVVGALLAALYDPLWTSTIGSRLDFALVLLALGMLEIRRLPPVWIVALFAAGGWWLF